MREPETSTTRGSIVATPSSRVCSRSSTRSRSRNSAPGLVTGASGLAKGAAGLDSIVSGLRFGPDGHTGVQAYAKGVNSFADGVGKYADGVAKLATGLGKLASGTDELALGGHGLAVGADQIADGATQLAGGTSQSATGAAKLYDGASKLSEGGETLADGTGRFADGLDKGKDQIPSYDKTLRNKLSSVVTTPVTTDTVRKIFPDEASTSLLTVIALWLGALASFLILRAVPARVLSSMKPSWRLALEGVLPAVVVGVVQAAALTAVLGALLHLDGSEIAALGGFASLTAVTFAVINQSLVAWFAGRGGSSRCWSSSSPRPGQSPRHCPRRSMSSRRSCRPRRHWKVCGRSSAAAAEPATPRPCWSGWLIIGAAASVLAVARRRMISPLAASLPA